MKQFVSDTSAPGDTGPALALDRLAKVREMSLTDVFAVILPHKTTVAIVTVLCALLALAFLAVRERPYVATSRILIDPVGLQVLDRDVVRRNESSDGGASVVESQMRVLTSESVLRQVVISENLVADPEFVHTSGNPLSAALSAMLGQKPEAADPELTALFNLMDAVAANHPQYSYIVDLFVKTKDAKKSAHLANAIARTYIESEVNARSGLARRASGTLSERLVELRAELTAAENAVEEYKSRNNILDTNGSSINEQELAQLNRLLVEAAGRTSLAESNLQQIEAARLSASDLDNIPEALGSQTISGLRIRLATALQRKSVLSADLLPSHPTMASADAEIEVVRAQIRQELTRIVGRAKAEVERARSEQAQIGQRLGTIKQTTYVANDARVRLRELARDADAKRVVYEAFLLRAKELGEQEGVDTTQARVISQAIPPRKPAGLSSLLILAFSVLAGLMIGILVALARGVFGTAPRENEPVKMSPPSMDPPPAGERPTAASAGQQALKTPAVSLSPEIAAAAATAAAAMAASAAAANAPSAPVDEDPCEAFTPRAGERPAAAPAGQQALKTSASLLSPEIAAAAATAAAMAASAAAANASSAPVDEAPCAAFTPRAARASLPDVIYLPSSVKPAERKPSQPPRRIRPTRKRIDQAL